MDEQDEKNQATVNPGVQPAAAPLVNDITPPPAPAVQAAAPAQESQQVNVSVDSSSAVEDAQSAAEAVAVEQNADAVEVSAVEETGSVEKTTEEDSSAVVAPPADSDEEMDELTEIAHETADVADTTPLAEAQQTPVASAQEEGPVAPVANTPAPSVDGAAPAAIGVSASQMNKTAHHNNKKLAIIVTLLVGLVLAGVAVYVYLSANNNAAENNTSQNEAASQTAANETTTPVTPVTAADVDQTNAELEEAMSKLDDTADFAAKDIDDTTLGL